MLDLIAFLLAQGSVTQSERELLERAFVLINSGQVVLSGTFAKTDLPLK